MGEDLAKALDGVQEHGPAGFEWRGRACPISEHALANPVTGNLSSYRYRGPIPGRDEERELIRRAQAGDVAAADKLVRFHHRQILGISKEYHGPPSEELIDAGVRGLWKAITLFDLRRNHVLATPARTYIRNEILAEVKLWRSRGMAGETRADRWLYYNRGATAEEIVAGCKAWGTPCSLESALQAIERAAITFVSFDTIKPRPTGDADVNDGRRIYSHIAPPLRGLRPRGLRDFAEYATIRFRAGLRRVVRQKAAAAVQLVLITFWLAARYLSAPVVAPATQQVLKRIGRLYKSGCSSPWRGTFKPWSNHVLLGGVELPGAQPRQAGGEVQVIRPDRITRYAELQRDMAAFNAGHGFLLEHRRAQQTAAGAKKSQFAQARCAYSSGI